MKTLLSIFFAIFLMANSYGQNQILKLNPLGFAFGNFNLRYERALNEKTSFQVGANFYSRKFIDVRFTVFGLDAEYRFYITHKKKQVAEGFYIGPTIGFDTNSANDDDNDVDGSVTLFGVGATIGYQWIWDSGITLELGAGPQYTFVVAKADEIEDTIEFDGFLPRLVFAIGYAF